MSREDRPNGSFTLARYKRLVLLGKISLPLEEARRIVGPDCAYHLYFRHAGDGAAKIGDGSRAGPIRRAARRRHK